MEAKARELKTHGYLAAGKGIYLNFLSDSESAI